MKGKSQIFITFFYTSKCYFFNCVFCHENFYSYFFSFRRLANVSGTIPVIYKEKTYNIPICVWLKIDHPSSCPMAFITPTNDMQIKVSHHVDQTGRIYMQCLDEWRYPDSTLTGLINICREIFGELPPVFAKTKTTSSHNSESVINTQNGNGK